MGAGTNRTVAMLGTLCVVAATAAGQRQSLTIEEVPLTLVDAAGTSRTIDLGDITVTLSNRGGAGMSAVFRVEEEHRPAGAAGGMWEHVELHWVNLITEDDCPATMRGIAAGRSGLPFPVVDMPRHGWDYVYKSRRAPRGRGPDRTESNADGREMRDDARDIWPWYHTPEEESMHVDSGNGSGGFGQFREGVVYGIRDLPSLCDRGGVTAFTTLLVAVVPSGRDGRGTETLQQGQLLVLGGFDWDWTTNGLRLAETGFSVEELDTALHNSHFPEWMGVSDVPVAVDSHERLGAEEEADPEAEAAPAEASAPAGEAEQRRGFGNKPKP